MLFLYGYDIREGFFAVNKILKDCLCNVVNRLNVF